jgi:hypothetical protein
MTEQQLWLVLAVAAIVVGGSFAVIAWSTWRVAGDARRTTQATERLMTMLDRELPPTLDALQQASRSLDRLAGEGGAQLAVIERVASEGELTMAAVRELSGSINEILRGPAETVTGVRKSARMVGGGIASGADRLRRVITRADDEDGADGGGR